MLALIDLAEPLGPMPAFVAPIVALALLVSLLVWRRKAGESKA